MKNGGAEVYLPAAEHERSHVGLESAAALAKARGPRGIISQMASGLPACAALWREEMAGEEKRPGLKL